MQKLNSEKVAVTDTQGNILLFSVTGGYLLKDMLEKNTQDIKSP